MHFYHEFYFIVVDEKIMGANLSERKAGLLEVLGNPQASGLCTIKKVKKISFQATGKGTSSTSVDLQASLLPRCITSKRQIVSLPTKSKFKDWTFSSLNKVAMLVTILREYSLKADSMPRVVILCWPLFFLPILESLKPTMCLRAGKRGASWALLVYPMSTRSAVMHQWHSIRLVQHHD